jgi:GTP-binding protein Era
MTHRCGFVSLIGRPNAGKSTLLNHLVGEKLAIVADKPQTTRTVVQGVLTTEDAQIILLDTPGIHQARSRLNQRMMDVAKQALADRDLLLLIADATKPVNEAEKAVIELAKSAETPIILVVNKMDALESKNLLLPVIAAYNELGTYEEVLPISALTGEGVPELLALIKPRLPEAPPMFPEDYLTDQPLRFLAAEFIREQVLRLTRQEVPHSVAVIVEEWEETPTLVRINATIMVERPGQKAIVIGTGGSMLKQIGTEARAAIERLVDTKVFLELFVKVRENWRDNPQFIEETDWRRLPGGKASS